MAGRRVARKSGEDAIVSIALAGVLVPLVLGCFCAPNGPNEDWEEDVQDRREARDDPESPEYRGDFEIELSGDIDARMTSFELGESTRSFVEKDLSGAPPHCLIKLADRSPDANGRQGYLLAQFFGMDCYPDPGEYGVVGQWDGIDASRQAVLKTVQIDTETGEVYRYETYGDPMGMITITQVSDSITGEIDVEMASVIVDDEDETNASLKIVGGFDAVSREE